MLLFSTLIYQKPFASKSLQKKLSRFWLKNLITECFQIQKVDLHGQAWSRKNYMFGFTTYASLNRLQDFSSSFAELKPLLDFHVFEYVKQLGYDITQRDLVLCDLWLNIMNHGAVHTGHVHPLSVISGTLYLQTDEASSSLKFEDPRLGLFMNAPPLKKKSAQQRFYFVKPKAGSLVLFESWLRHEVVPNRSQTPRISLSFNYNWSRA
jgi:uncharacterized protein (TIGR02466 family)